MSSVELHIPAVGGTGRVLVTEADVPHSPFAYECTTCGSGDCHHVEWLKQDDYRQIYIRKELDKNRP
jgi:hypothetical protein